MKPSRNVFVALLASGALGLSTGCSSASGEVEGATTYGVAGEDLTSIAPIVGISLPPPHGPSGTSAFSSAALANDYQASTALRTNLNQVLASRGAIRLAINPATVQDANSWSTTRQLVHAALADGTAVVLCMWDSPKNDVNHDGHGDGRVDDLAAATRMWNEVALAYHDSPSVYFEAFNEPFGYAVYHNFPTDTEILDYVGAMKRITASLQDTHRVILDGLGYADNVKAVAKHWGGLLGYHVYPNWKPVGQRTQSEYSNLIQAALSNLGPRTLVTEFGANLSLPNVSYQDSSVSMDDVQFLKGVDDAFNVVKPKGTFLWHGWDNGDSYSFESATISARREVDSIQSY